MRCEVLVLLALLLGLLVAPAADAAPSKALAREVTLRGSGTGWVAVSLPKPVTFAKGVAPQVVSVSDPAAFVGVFLVREQAGTWPPGVGVVALPRDGGLPYAHVVFGHERGTDAEDDLPMAFRRTLAPGKYRLYLLARGSATLTVRLRFPVAAGRQTYVVPRNTSHSDVAALAPGVPGVAVSAAHSHGGTFPLRRRGLLLNISWWQGDFSAHFESGGCAYSGPLPDPGPAVPTCPNGPGAMLSGTEVNRPVQKLVTGYLYGHPGQWLQKAYFTVAGSVQRAGIAHYWLDLGAGFPRA